MPKHTRGVRLRAMGAVAACSLALVACGGDKDDDTAPAAKDETASASPDDDLGGLLSGEPDEEDRGDPAELLEAMEGVPLVLEEGKGPRAQLAVELAEGQQAVSTMQMTMEMTFNGKTSPSMPMTMVVSTTVQDVTDEMTTIRATYDDVEFDETGMPPELVEQLESELAALEGIAITVDQSPTGALLDTRFSLADNAPPSAHQMVEQIASSLTSYSVPFPTEPVGEGASWSVVDTVDSYGFSMVQTATYVLEEFDGRRYRIRTELEGTFEPTKIDGAVELARGSMAGTGETTGALGQLMPDSGTSEASTTMVMKAGGRRVTTVTDVDMTITTESN